MGIVNKEQRMAALRRQELLYELHCKYCINRNTKSNTKYCPGCAIWDEFQDIGKVLNGTITERKEDIA